MKNSANKADKMPAPEQVRSGKKRRIALAGQRQFNSLKGAMDHVNETLGMLHTQTHDSLKKKGRR